MGLMDQQNPDQMQDQQRGEQDKPQGPQLSPEGRAILAGARMAMTKDGFKAIFDKGLQQASFPAACALMVSTLLQKGEEQEGDLDPEEAFSDGGVADAILAALFRWLEIHGYKEGTDAEIYAEALDLVEQMGHQEPDADQQGGPSDQDQDNQPGNARPAISGGLMAG